MIQNPAIQGGSEKEYTITGGYSDVPTKAKPGTSVLLSSGIEPTSVPTVTAMDGLIIPVAIEYSYPEIKQDSKVREQYQYFIMPAQDVAIKY